MRRLRHRWAHLSIHYKAVVLCGVFILPILMMGTLLMIEFNAYRLETDRILSEYGSCIDYSNALRTEQDLLDTLTFASPDSQLLTNYKNACIQTAATWEPLSGIRPSDSEQIRTLKQSIGRTMENYTTRRSLFLYELQRNTFDAQAFADLQAQSDFIMQYVDALTDTLLFEGHNSYLALGQQITGQNIVFFAAAVVGCICLALAIVFLTRALILPVRQMSKAARRVASGFYEIADFYYPYTDEIGMLAGSFNHMKHQIASTIQALENEAQLEKNLRQQEAEAAHLRQLVEQSRFAQLQSQINPHFLFNTLQSVANMANLEHATVTGDMVVRLANFFRYTLETDDSLVTLARELDLLRDYISLQEMRFGERISFEMDCDPQCMSIPIPKFTLQPLVENSIVHGMRCRTAGGRIRIVTTKTDNGCRIQITDNGCGYDTAADAADTSHSIGLQNIASRIALMGGTFRLFSRIGLGTTARLTLPTQGDVPHDQGTDRRR